MGARFWDPYTDKLQEELEKKFQINSGVSVQNAVNQQQPVPLPEIH